MLHSKIVYKGRFVIGLPAIFIYTRQSIRVTLKMSAIYRLQCKTQSYDWGKLGNVSKAAAYAKASGTTVEDNVPYAELWMGTHPNAPSIVLDDNNTTLGELIKNNVELSTRPVYDQYHGDLPFLFKILSIRKALSIQAHPDKTLGARLFEEFPENYRDPNHKVSE